MKRRDLERHLRQHGCILHHHGGRHDIWLNPIMNRRAPVERRREIPKPVVRAICEQLAIPRARL